MTEHRDRQRVTIKNVAEFAGVSRSTAAYIMSGNSKYTFLKETVSRVHAAARALRYVPNPIATSLRTRRNNIIIGVFGNVFREMELVVSQALKDAFFKHGYYFIAQFMTNMEEKEKLEFFKKVYRWGAGLVIYDIGIDVDSPYRKDILELLSLSPPSVSLMNEIKGSQVDYLKIEWFKHLPKVFKYFKSLKRKKIVYCCTEITPEIRRRFQDESRKCGMHFEAWCYSDTYSAEDKLRFLYRLGEMAAEYILSHPDDRPDAMCCFSDEVAMALQQKLAPAGIRIPEDISIVSGGDRSYINCKIQPFPVFSYSPREIAEISAEYLVDRIEAGQQVSGTHHCIREIDEHLSLPLKQDSLQYPKKLHIE